MRCQTEVPLLIEGSGHFMLVGGDRQGRGKEPMGAVIGMGVWGLDPVSKPAIGGTVVGQLALIKTNGLQPKL